jgi:hypothetical protein
VPSATARTEDRVVSLTARPATIEDAALLILLGQRVSRGNDAVTGGEIIGVVKVIIPNIVSRTGS